MTDNTMNTHHRCTACVCNIMVCIQDFTRVWVQLGPPLMGAEVEVLTSTCNTQFSVIPKRQMLVQWFRKIFFITSFHYCFQVPNVDASSYFSLASSLATGKMGKRMDIGRHGCGQLWLYQDLLEWFLCSHSHTPCQVPRLSLPSVMGIVTLLPSKFAFTWAGWKKH